MLYGLVVFYSVPYDVQLMHCDSSICAGALMPEVPGHRIHCNLMRAQLA
jgi:hypothetical protein